jgi:hypothetical protein
MALAYFYIIIQHVPWSSKENQEISHADQSVNNTVCEYLCSEPG